MIIRLAISRQQRRGGFCPPSNNILLWYKDVAYGVILLRKVCYGVTFIPVHI